MAELHPTPTRLNLLRDIADGLVVVYPGEAAFVVPSLSEFYDPFNDRRRKVTGRVNELVNAGWVELRVFSSDLSPDLWVLTEAGRKVLEEADRAH